MPLFDFLKSDGGNFFGWFEEASDIALKASRALRDLCYDYSNPRQAVSLLHELEHQGDDVGHQIYDQLHHSFVTPMDREDIISLYSSIDDMIDYIHSAADMMEIYKVESITPTAQGLADCIVGAAEEIAAAVPKLRKRSEMNSITEAVITVNSLENKADDLLRIGLGELFSEPHDVLHIIKWRDIYDEMEKATDKAEDIADVLRGLVIKHA